VRLRFRALTLRGRTGNFAILGFERAAGRDAMRAVATAIMRTFRPTPESSEALSMIAAPAAGAAA
jgi:hypothetical protein